MMSQLILSLYLLFLQLSTFVAMNCQYDDHNYVDGQLWKADDNHYMLKCSVTSDGSWSVTVDHCLTPNGQPIALNGTIEENGNEYRCLWKEKGLYEWQQLATTCKYNQDIYRNGDQFRVRNMYVMQCVVDVNGWRVTAIACLTPNGDQIAIDSSKVEENRIYRCWMNGKLIQRSAQTLPQQQIQQENIDEPCKF